MKFQKWLVPGLFSVCCLAAVIGSLALAQEKNAPKKEAAPIEFKLPPGWTQADLQACMAAGTPGDMQQFLAARQRGMDRQVHDVDVSWR